MDVHIQRLLSRQLNLIARWQLEAAGWSKAKIDHRVRHHHWRVIHRGVYAVTYASLTRLQRWMAATLTTPDSFLSHGSAGAAYGFWRFERPFEVITRPGNGGKRRTGGLLVFRSSVLDGETTTHLGVRITSAERVLLDIAPGLRPKWMGRAFREALRLETTTAERIRQIVERHPGSRGTALLGELAVRYAPIPYWRCRSPAEARALEVLHDAGVPPPLLNVRVGGEEADLVWPARKRIIEIDGPQYHQFAEEDARKEAIWRQAGYTVDRIPSGDVFDRPRVLLALAA